jgi:glycosyltransferase involved in cell wall biosynthesis
MSSPNRLRLLFVAPFPPRLDGTHGGAKVVGQLLRGTADRHAVGIVYLRHPREPDLDDVLRDRLAFVEPVLRPVPARHTAAHWVRALRWRARLLAGHPRLVTELAAPAFAARIRDAVSRWQPDVVRLEYPVAASYVGALAESDAARVLADYDALLETARLPRSAADHAERLLDLRAWRRFRRRILAYVDAAVVPTERDRRALLPLSTRAEVACIPFGADVDVPALNPAGSDDAGVVFVGNFNHVPNIDAARRLADEILPLIRRERPDARLCLVGERPPKLTRLDGVDVTGKVADVKPFLDAAAVVVAPLHLGAGIRVKVVDALVAGKAVVASSHAVEGLPLEPGRHALIADDSHAFAAAVTSLLANRSRRVELARNARRWARAELGWDRPLDEYDALYGRVLARRRTASRDERARS